jgi:hypothetical protein
LRSSELYKRYLELSIELGDNGTFPPEMIAPGVNAAVEEYYNQRGVVDQNVKIGFAMRFRGLFGQIFSEPVMAALTEMGTIEPPRQ